MKKYLIYTTTVVLIVISFIFIFSDSFTLNDNDIIPQNTDIIIENIDDGKNEVKIDDEIITETDTIIDDTITGEVTEEIVIEKPIENDIKEQEIVDEIEKIQNNVTISITCNTILDNIDKLSQNKVSLVPSNGIILPKTEVEISDGDSVFDVLSKITKEKKIHFEFVNTPIYGSSYIEGINNLYEFDCGELSGWMFKVNGYFPGNGITNYILQKNDVIEIVYTCDLGNDVR